MAVTTLQANPGFFGAAGAAFTREADRATNLLMQERELALAQDAQKLQESQFKSRVEQLELDRALKSEEVAANITSAATRDQLIAAQTAAQLQATAQAPDLFALQTRQAEAEIALTTAEAEEIPERVGIARGNLAIANQQVQLSLNSRAQEIVQQEQQIVAQLASNLGVSPLLVGQMMFGRDVAQPGARLQQVTSMLAGSESEDAFATLSTEQRSSQVFANLGFSTELESQFRDDITAGRTPLQMVQDVQANEGMDEATKAQSILAIQLINPGFQLPQEIKTPGFFRSFREFLNSIQVRSQNGFDRMDIGR